MIPNLDSKMEFSFIFPFRLTQFSIISLAHRVTVSLWRSRRPCGTLSQPRQAEVFRVSFSPTLLPLRARTPVDCFAARGCPFSRESSSRGNVAEFYGSLYTPRGLYTIIVTLRKFPILGINNGKMMIRRVPKE